MICGIMKSGRTAGLYANYGTALLKTHACLVTKKACLRSWHKVEAPCPMRDEPTSFDKLIVIHEISIRIVWLTLPSSSAMVNRLLIVLMFAITILIVCAVSSVSAWHDKAHIAVMDASGAPYSSCLAISPDVVATKLPKEAANHFTYVDKVTVTINDVSMQVKYYDSADSKGHLYGAIVAAANNVRDKLAKCQRPDYSYSFLAHYVGDISQPLHNSPFDLFNKVNHGRIDGIVDNVSRLTQRIVARMVPMCIRDDIDLAASVARIANVARIADGKLRYRKTMSHDDALELLGHSASLLRAITVYITEKNVNCSLY